MTPPGVLLYHTLRNSATLHCFSIDRSFYGKYNTYNLTRCSWILSFFLIRITFGILEGLASPFVCSHLTTGVLDSPLYFPCLEFHCRVSLLMCSPMLFIRPVTNLGLIEFSPAPKHPNSQFPAPRWQKPPSHERERELK